MLSGKQIINWEQEEENNWREFGSESIVNAIMVFEFILYGIHATSNFATLPYTFIDTLLIQLINSSKNVVVIEFGFFITVYVYLKTVYFWKSILKQYILKQFFGMKCDGEEMY